MDDTEPEIRHCELCGDPFMPEQPTQIYCSDKHRRTAEKRRQRLRKRMAKHSDKLVSGVQTHASADDDLMSLHARTTRRSDAPPPPLPGHRDDDHNEQDARMHDLMRQQAQPTVRREWLAWGPTSWHRASRADLGPDRSPGCRRIRERRRSFDARDAGRAQDRFDRRTIGNMGRRGQESRRLNAGHQGYGVLPSQDFDMNETIRNANLYRRGPGTSGRARLPIIDGT